MSLALWLAGFRDLHEKSQRGQLSPGEAAAYRAGRDELARALLGAQRLTLRPGETPRQALRVARALQVDLETATTQVRAITLDLSTGGFGVLLAKPPPAGEEIRYSLRLPGAEPISGRARLVEVKPQPGNTRVAFAFQDLADADRDRLEMLIFDSVLAQLLR